MGQVAQPSAPEDDAILERTDGETRLQMYEQMFKIRTFEQHVNQLYLNAQMPGLPHPQIGQEAVAVGVCEALHREDYITSTHREHGHCLAKGATLNRMLAELLGKAPGYCRGNGGSMHIADQETGNLGANAIVGGSASTVEAGCTICARMWAVLKAFNSDHVLCRSIASPSSNDTFRYGCRKHAARST